MLNDSFHSAIASSFIIVRRLSRGASVLVDPFASGENLLNRGASNWVRIEHVAEQAKEFLRDHNIFVLLLFADLKKCSSEFSKGGFIWFRSDFRILLIEYRAIYGV